MNESRTLIANANGSTGRISIRAYGLTKLRCSRLMPLGPSEFINSATYTESEHGQVLLIEMQTGDEIEIVCTRAIFGFVG